MAAHILTAWNDTFPYEFGNSEVDTTIEKMQAFLYALDYARFGDLLIIDEHIIIKALLQRAILLVLHGCLSLFLIT